MAFLTRLNEFISTFLAVFRQLGQWRIWFVLLGYYLAQWLILFVHYDYPSGSLSQLMTFWVSLFGPETADAYGHYPQHFLLLGRVSYWAKLIFGLVFEGLVLGMVAGMFCERYRNPDESGKTSRLARWFNLTLVWTIVNGLMLAAGQLLPGLAAPYLVGPRRIVAFSFVFMPLVFSLTFAVFFLAIPSVIMYGDDALRAVGRSIRFFLGRPITIFAFALFILAVPILIGALASRPGGIVESFKPELVYWILVTSLISEMIAGFFWMGVAVRFLYSEER
ncbi:MAG: hypothetical protein AB1772_11805 [Candidatus Zixiibacteriota bacterium]